MRENVESDRIRQRHEAAYKFMTAIAGDLAGYEEALRSLFANDQAGLLSHIAAWPEDVKHFTLALAFPFSRLVSDRWTVTARTGTKMYHTWKWGPGKYSIERWTEGEDAQGEPWRELIVYYWHPQEKQVRFLGISPYASGINQGTINFDRC